MDFWDQLSMLENQLFEEKTHGYIDPYLVSSQGHHFNFDDNLLLQPNNHMPLLEFDNFADIENDILYPSWDVNPNWPPFFEDGIIDTNQHMPPSTVQNLVHGANLEIIKGEIPIVNYDYGSSSEVVPSECSSAIENKELVISNSYKNQVRRCYRLKSTPLELNEIKKYFSVPLPKAAKELKVGSSVLRKRCRKLKIKRWPYTRIKSLELLKDNVKEFNEVKLLEENKSMLEKVPQLELTENK